MEPINYSFPTNLSLHEPGPYYNTFLFDKLYSHLDHIHISWAPPKQSLQLKVWKTYGFEFMILLKKIWSSKFLCYLHHHEIMPQEKKGHTLQDCRMNCMSAPFALITLKSDKILSCPPLQLTFACVVTI